MTTSRSRTTRPPDRQRPKRRPWVTTDAASSSACNPRLSPSSSRGSRPERVAVRTCPGRAPPCTPPERRFNPPAGRVGAAGPPGHRSGATSTRTSFDRATPMARTGHGARPGRSALPAWCEDRRMSRPLERIALISDVHGNLTALEAVLADIDARGIGRIFNLGDYVGKGPRGRRGRRPVPGAVRGQPPRQLGRLPARPGPHLRQRVAPVVAGAARSRPGRVAAVAAVQPRLRDQRPAGPAVPRLRGDRAPPGPLRPRRGGVPRRCSPTPRRPATARRRTWSGTPTPTTPTTRPTTTGGRVFNTGSVGNCMHDPTPVYVILEGVLDSPDDAPFSIQFVRVPYDVDAELAAATATGAARAGRLRARDPARHLPPQPHRARGRAPDLPPAPGRGRACERRRAPAGCATRSQAADYTYDGVADRARVPRRTPPWRATRRCPACAVPAGDRRSRR